MNRRLIAIAVGALTAGAIAAGPIAAATASQADTVDCASAVQTHNGVTGNYCGSQAMATVGLDLSVPNRAAAYSRLTFKATNTTSPQLDWQFFNPLVHGDNQKLAEYDPYGVPSGLYLTVSNNGGLPVLKPLKDDGASPGQQWIAEGPTASGGYAWVSEANGKALDNPNLSAYTRAVLAPNVGSAGESFNFVQ